MNSKAIGERSEAAVMASLLKAAEVVLFPFGDNQRYDLVLDRDGVFVRIQVKTGRLKNGAIGFNLCSSYAHRGRGTRNYRGQCEFFGVFCPELDEVYLVPVEAVGTSWCSLRVAPLKGSNGREPLWAEDYRVRISSLRDESRAFPKREAPVDPCPICGAPKKIRQKFCSQKCFQLARRKVEWPSKDELMNLIDEKIPFTQIGKRYGVTDNAVRKWAKRYGIIPG